MKRKIVFLTMMMALAGEAAIVYRGRLVPNSQPNAATTFSGVVTRDMTFTIYDEGGTPCCKVERKGVRIAPGGTFSVVLESPELTESVKLGEAASIGLAVGKAPEIQPRRHLLPLGRVNHATVADGLAPDAQVRTLTANNLVCDTLTAKGSVMAKRVIGADGRLNRIAYRLPSVGPDETLELVRGDGITVFGTCQRMMLKNGADTMSAKAGDALCEAPGDGVATICCMTTQDASKSQGGPATSFVRFCRKGESICVPSEWTSVKGKDTAKFAVDFHPFVTAANDR